MVRNDLLARGIVPNWLTVGRLARYLPNQYEALFALVDMAKSQKVEIARLHVARFEVIRSVDYSKITLPELRENIRGAVFNFIPLQKQYQVRDRSVPIVAPYTGGQFLSLQSEALRTIINLFTQERQHLVGITRDPTSRVEDVFRRLDESKSQLGFLNVVIYRPLDDGTNRWILTQRTRNWDSDGGSKYDQERGGLVPVSTLRSVLETNGTVFDVDIDDTNTFERQGLMFDAASRRNDRERSKGPGRMLFIKLVDRDNKPVAVIQIHNRVNKEDPISPPPLLPGDHSLADSIKKQLELYFGDAVWAIEMIRSREKVVALGTNGTGPVQASPVRSPAEAAEEFRVMMSRKSSLKQYGIFQVGRITHPGSALNGAEKDLLIDALNWKGREREDMANHLVDVAEIVVVFHNGNPIAFGSGIEIDFQNQGQGERLQYMVGTMAQPDYYGYSLQTLVNGLFLMRSWWRYKFEGGLLRSPHPIMRTRSVGPAVGFIRYFSNVVYKALAARTLARAVEFNRFMSSDCDREGVARNAYTEPVGDPQRDGEIMASLKKKDRSTYRKLREAFYGLSEYDARTFQGNLNLWNVLKIWFYLNVIFTYKYRHEKNVREA
ncbi:hypothetical protein A2311_04820 [candidate division WOR-1 bacterium RIFOXYB2_FULL_48_7]|uniref:Uncharacterized protein n=1 Tax=candidate division WOR-1 bacterium RIFOXYB2_FULL_48_7 TaxID=1802583 RepID=A0A1F4TWB7_UNCSA|nr:MAG: hypothetical protein A2311_04820 [candidate division WOR-1 bacterium RIFOXYB2_FULL_48_7]